MTIKPLTQRRFIELLGPEIGPLPCVHEEIAWFASEDGTRIGAVICDLVDHDFSWVMLERDEHGQYRAVDLDCSLPSAEAAQTALTQHLCGGVS